MLVLTVMVHMLMCAPMGWGTPQRAVDAPPPPQRLLGRGGGTTRLGRHARIDDAPPLARTGRQRRQKRLHGVRTPCAEARPPPSPHAHAPDHDEAGGRRDDGCPHGAPRAVTAARPGKGQPGPARSRTMVDVSLAPSARPAQPKRTGSTGRGATHQGKA